MMRKMLVLLLLLGVLPLPANARGVASVQSASPHLLVQIAMVVENSPLPMRRDFAWLAITEMAGMYTSEAVRARHETRRTARAGDAARWAASVDDYAAKMQALAESITSATQVEITITANRQINLYVGGEPVIVTGAFSGQQAEYEKRVVDQFCVLYLCEQLLARFDLPPPDAAAIARKKSASGAYWSFSQHSGPVCMTDDGLEFQFSDLSGIREKRAACSQIVAELYELVFVLQHKRDAGIPVDWGALKINPLAGSDGHQVILNGVDDIRMPLPGLAASKDLFRIVRPWLVARVKGLDLHLVVLNAGQLMQGIGE